MDDKDPTTPAANAPTDFARALLRNRLFHRSNMHAWKLDEDQLSPNKHPDAVYYIYRPTSPLSEAEGSLLRALFESKGLPADKDALKLIVHTSIKGSNIPVICLRADVFIDAVDTPGIWIGESASTARKLNAPQR